MNTFVNNKKGFTLVEVIVSIAILGIVSGIVLKLFVLSDDLSNRVTIEDIAATYASNAIEICKSYNSPNKIMEDSFFEQGEISKENGQEKCILYFDESFNKVKSEGKFKLTIIIRNASENISLPLSIGYDENDNNINSCLYNIQVTVEGKKENEYKSIINYTTDKYYVFKE